MTGATPDPAPATDRPLLDVSGLSISARDGDASRTITTGTDLTLAEGETIGIVGESGSGKSLTARALVGLLPRDVIARGTIRFAGRDLTRLTEAELAKLRGAEIALLLQDPFTMLNPLLTCGRHIEEVLPEQPALRTRQQRFAEVLRRLAEVGITDPHVAERWPFQLSGGMCQRVALASALARDPRLLIADEPSTALDVTTQAEILKLLRGIQRRRAMSLIFITHDLRLAFSTCDRVYVLYAGSLMEVGDAADIQREPFHPYTLGLLLSEPPATRRVPELVAIRGSVASADSVRGMCSFAPRCDWATDECRGSSPPLVARDPGRFSACLRQPDIRHEMKALRDRALALAPAPARGPALDRPLVRVTGLVKTFEGRGGRKVHALKGVALEVRAGESVGLVGESGSGKTTLGRCIVGLETPTQGDIEIGGVRSTDVPRLGPEPRARHRRTIQMIFQDPYSTLNPRHTVRMCLAEALRMADDDGAPAGGVAALLAEVGLPAAFAERYPAALSGGERQRVAIARALAVRPRVIVCDEPVSALDVSVQAQILNLFKRLQEQLGLSYVFITHDLAVVRQVADRVYVLYLGEIVESGPTEEVMSNPRHAYTRRLIESIPQARV